MPDYVAPGLYRQEISVPPVIRGMPTSTAGFPGPVRYGPVGAANIVGSLAAFERLHGDGADLVADGRATPNYLWHAARAFFAEGGSRLAVTRLFVPADPDDPWSGHARCACGGLNLHARFPGRAGNASIRITLELARTADDGPGQHILWDEASRTFAPSAAGGTGIPVLARIAVLRGAEARVFPGLSLEPAHPNFICAAFAGTGSEDDPPVVVTMAPGTSGLDILDALTASNPSLTDAFADPAGDEEARTVVLDLTDGDDGLPASLDAYRTGLGVLEHVEEISTVAAPGSTAEDGPLAAEIAAALLDHAGRMRYRLAIVDSVRGHDMGQTRAFRAGFGSEHGAFYSPWIAVADPAVQRPLLLPPSGFVAGIFARVDVQRGIARVPANEPVGLAIGLERPVTQQEQDRVNLEGINCFRQIPARGFRLMGGRTMSGLPEWKYVSTRRYVSYIEHSIAKGLDWCVFEENGQALWAKTRATVEAFLLEEWRKGHLAGENRDEAFFVRCDETTTTREEIDAGLLVCLIGVATIKPAEFLIVRTARPTASAKPAGEDRGP